MVYYCNIVILLWIVLFVDYLIEVLGGGSGGDVLVWCKVVWMVL